MTDKIKVVIDNKQKKVKIPTGIRMLVRRCCNAVLRMEDFREGVEVNVSFVNNEQIYELNKKHRNKEEPTDVLSFPLGENGQYDTNPESNLKMLGDIVISMETAVEQSRQFGHSLQREVAYLTVHSMLHLLGYDHEKGGLEMVHMREKEEQVLSMLGLSRVSSYVLEDEE